MDSILSHLANATPSAHARLKGSASYPGISGLVQFYETKEGVYIWTQVKGLPADNASCGFFAYHIHEGTSCMGGFAQPFSDALGHYNPHNQPHPCHAGDLPPLLASPDGTASALTLTTRFNIDEILGRTIIIHLNADDFKTQPSGDSGERIACGIIIPYIVYKVLL